MLGMVMIGCVLLGIAGLVAWAFCDDDWPGDWPDSWGKGPALA